MYWPLVRGGVEKVIERTGKVSFCPEDVYASIANGKNALIMSFQNNVYAGFCILGHEVDPFSGRRRMLMWLGYSLIPGAVEATLPFIEELGRRAGVDYISFHTSRKGWDRLAPRLGYEPLERVYYKCLR